MTSRGDLTKLDKWNWGAFLLAPVWALVHTLDKWAILWFIPVVNFFVMYHLGRNGNRLAFRKSTLSVDDFLVVQQLWVLWAKRLIAIGLLISLLTSLL